MSGGSQKPSPAQAGGAPLELLWGEAAPCPTASFPRQTSNPRGGGASGPPLPASPSPKPTGYSSRWFRDADREAGAATDAETEIQEVQKMQKRRCWNCTSCRMRLEGQKLQTKMLEVRKMQKLRCWRCRGCKDRDPGGANCDAGAPEAAKTDMLELQKLQTEMLEVQTEMLEVQGPSRRAQLQVPLQYWAPAMSGAIGGAPPAAPTTGPMPVCLIEPPPSPPAPALPAGGTRPPPLRVFPQPRRPALGRDAGGMQGSAPRPSCPTPAQSPSVTLRVWGFLKHLCEILVPGAAVAGLQRANSLGCWR